MKPITKTDIIRAYNNANRETREHIYQALLAFDVFINVDKNGYISDIKRLDTKFDKPY